MDPLLATVATTAVVEGTKFLYNQASEVLKTWRARRRGDENAEVTAVSVPDSVVVGELAPMHEPRDSDMEDALAELRDRARQVVDGMIDPDSRQARAIAADLRDYLEVVLRAPITMEGEQPRSFDVGNVGVVVGRVEGEVTAVLAEGRSATVGDVVVRSADVGKDGRVTGVHIR